jgi:hypothetical protein
MTLRQLRNRDVQVAPGQRGEQQGKRHMRAEADARVSEAQHPHLDPGDQDEKYPGQQGKMRQRQGQVFKLVQIHL